MIRRLIGAAALLGLLAAPAAAQDPTTTATLSSTTCPGTGCVTLTGGTGKSQATVTVTGTFFGALQASIGASAAALTDVAVYDNGGTRLSTITRAGIYTVPIGAATTIRVRFSSYASGTPSVQLTAGAGGPVASPFPPMRMTSDTINGFGNFAPLDVTGAGFVYFQVQTTTLNADLRLWQQNAGGLTIPAVLLQTGSNIGPFDQYRTEAAHFNGSTETLSFMAQLQPGMTNVWISPSNYTAGTATIFVEATTTAPVPIAHLYPSGTPLSAASPGYLVGGIYQSNKFLPLPLISGPMSTGSAFEIGVTTHVASLANVLPGTNGNQLGKNEDGAHASGDVGVFALNVRKDTATQTTNADGDYAQLSVDAYGAAFVRQDHPNRVACTGDGITTTATVLTGCSAPAAGLAIYVTDIFAVSTSTTAGAVQLLAGTGANCSVGTAPILPPGSGRHVGVATSDDPHPVLLTFKTPIRLPTAAALCALAGTQAITVLVSGFIAP
jgi:hypothetical protein